VRLLITGGAGFIGSTLVRQALAEGHEVVVLDALTYAGRREHLPDGVAFRRGRVEDYQSFLNVMGFVRRDGRSFDAVLHLAAESHVDRSIEDGNAFVTTNVLGTQVLLQALHQVGWRGRFVHVSTDEVYGALAPDEPAWKEDAPFKPTSPYAASKAAAEHFVMSHHRTYGTDVVITRGSNTYGPRQHPEKLIPLMVQRALADEPLPVYGDGLQQRDWLHVDDHARGILAALEHGTSGEVYNLGGSGERVNLDVVETLLDHLDRPKSLISFVTDRLAHDRRYLMDCTRARDALGWEPRVGFDEGFARTVAQLAVVLVPG
jgi:dTDP-glucose 4,6-dehydratase